ncbi:hypothetical protein ABIA95_008749 [Bradyrhizobium sp. LA8.1]
MAFQLLEIVGADRTVQAAVEADEREALWRLVGEIEEATVERFDGKFGSLLAGDQHKRSFLRGGHLLASCDNELFLPDFKI